MINFSACSICAFCFSFARIRFTSDCNALTFSCNSVVCTFDSTLSFKPVDTPSVTAFGSVAAFGSILSFKPVDTPSVTAFGSVAAFGSILSFKPVDTPSVTAFGSVASFGSILSFKPVDTPSVSSVTPSFTFSVLAVADDTGKVSALTAPFAKNINAATATLAAPKWYLRIE